MMEEKEYELNPNDLFEPFKTGEGDNIDVTWVLMNICWLLQSDKDKKWTKEEFMDAMETFWDHTEKIPKVSKYQ